MNYVGDLKLNFNSAFLLCQEKPLEAQPHVYILVIDCKLFFFFRHEIIFKLTVAKRVNSVW